MLHFHPLKIAEVRPETYDSVCIVFEVPDDLKESYRFVQGQHLTLKTTLDGEEVRRTYSICSGVDDGVLRIGIRKVKDGRFSTWANKKLETGQTIDVLTPTGGFHTELGPANEKTYLAIAGGAGITPILSIIKTTLVTEPNSRFILLFGNRTTTSIMFREDLEDLKNRFMGRLSIHHFLDGEEQDIDVYSGAIVPDRLRELFGKLFEPSNVDEFFVCGPNTMIEDISGLLVESGVSPDHIHFEHFTTEPLREQKTAGGKKAEEVAAKYCRVTVILDGIRSEFDVESSDQTLLDAALDLGTELPFACKGGVCGTCRAVLKEGRVDMATNYALEDYEIEAGFVLACQSRPLTDRVVLDFDEA